VLALPRNPSRDSRRVACTLAVLGLWFTAACSEAGSATPTEYRAQVRWTRFGIPHYLADDMASVAYAAGYVESRDVVCILADQFVRLRAERAKHLGPGELDANLTLTSACKRSACKPRLWTRIPTWTRQRIGRRGSVRDLQGGSERLVAERARGDLPPHGGMSGLREQPQPVGGERIEIAIDREQSRVRRDRSRRNDGIPGAEPRVFGQQLRREIVRVARRV
jgi:Penicillin amidase